jgi:hypothetical protein
LDIEDLEVGATKQSAFIANEISKFVEVMLPEVEDVSLWLRDGNHGRHVKARPRSTEDNWDLMSYRLLERQFSNFGRVNITISTDYLVAHVMDWGFHLRHGDEVSCYMGIPYYGIDRLAPQWKQSIPDWDVLVLGHFHRLASWESNTIPVVMSGTYVSDDRYGIRKWGTLGTNKMWLWGVHPRRPMTFRYAIEVRKDV